MHDASRRSRRSTASIDGGFHDARAFTLVELLIVMAVIGVLIGLLLPAIQSAREAARRMTCTGRLTHLSLAVQNYETVERHLPPGRVGCDDTPNIDVCPPGLPPEKKTAASGFIPLLPYFEMQALYEQLAIDRGGLWNRNVDDLAWWYNYPGKARGIQERVASLVCPSDDSEPISDVYAPALAATGNYAFVQGSKGPGSPRPEAKYENDGMFLYVKRRKAGDVLDGLSRTLMAGEVVMAHWWESSNTWTYARLNSDCLRTTEFPLNTRPGAGYPYEGQNGSFASRHPDGAVFAYGDGHVEFVRADIELIAYRALSTIAGED
jgi:prepilin-type N-terminal cleavage/methylation domain-containing protein/prepilin-type processing-associated H-X9-DG protein